MAKFRKNPIVVEAITFDELVAIGRAQTLDYEDMPWSFPYQGKQITHESDDCYLIPTLEGTMPMTRNDMLITGVQGELYPCKIDIFQQTYTPVEPEHGCKSLHNTDINGAKQNVSDIKVFGNGDTFQLLCKASSEQEGWMKSTKAMPVTGLGCVVQVTTQQRNPDGSYSIAEAVTFVPGVMICSEFADDGLTVVARRLVTIPALAGFLNELNEARAESKVGGQYGC